MAANGNSGNSTGQSAASAQAAAAAGNAAASNAANSGTGNTSNSSTSTNTSNTSGESSGKGTTSNATNSAGLMGSLIGFGNAVAKGEVGNGGGGSDGKSDGKKSDALSNALRNDKIAHSIQNIFTSAEKARGRIPSYITDEGDKAYTKARAEGKTEAEAQAIARNVVDKALSADTPASSLRPALITLAEGKGIRNADAAAFEGKNTGPTYNPSVSAMANTNKTIAKGSSEMGPSAPAAAPAAAPASPATNNTPGGNLGGETGGIVSGAAPTNVSDATNAGVTNRGSTVANGGGTSVTDSGSGGSISSSITPPSRDASSIGLGVYDNDRANYDQDNWNRGMEVESSSLVSDEECKAFAKRAFMENSEPFKKVRISIIKKC